MTVEEVVKCVVCDGFGFVECSPHWFKYNDGIPSTSAIPSKSTKTCNVCNGVGMVMVKGMEIHQFRFANQSEQENHEFEKLRKENEEQSRAINWLANEIARIFYRYHGEGSAEASDWIVEAMKAAKKEEQ